MGTITERKQIAALASPVRLTLVDTLEAVGPCSVATLAAMVGTRPDGLYYHLRLLARHRLVKRMRGGAKFGLTSRSLSIHYDAGDRGNVAAVTRVVSAMLRGALRAFRAAFKPPVRTSGKRRELWAGQRTVRLSPKQLESINGLLNELLVTFDEARNDEAGGRLYSLTFVLSPQGRAA